MVEYSNHISMMRAIQKCNKGTVYPHPCWSSREKYVSWAVMGTDGGQSADPTINQRRGWKGIFLLEGDWTGNGGFRPFQRPIQLCISVQCPPPQK